MKLHLPLSLRKNVLSCLLTAFSITIAAGAIEYLQDDSGLQDGNQSRETLTLENGQQMTLNGNSVDSSLNLSDGTLSLDYGSATAPSSMQGNDLTLSGGTTLHLIPGTTTDGKYINLLTNVGTLCGADGSQLIFSSDNANNAASQYFDTSQPGSGYWKDATLQLTSDGTLQMQLHNETVKDALTITTRQTDSVNYCYYESISFEDIVYSTSSSTAYGGAIYGGDDSPITLSNNGSVTFSGNKATSSGYYAYGGSIYGGNYSTITLSDNGSVTFSGNTATASSASGGAIYGGDDSTITLSNNGSVTFDGNSTRGGGGAIFGGDDSTITLSGNGSVTFSGNTSTSSGRFAEGGAIYGEYDSTITLSDNGSVTFDGNTAGGGSYAYGGAIYGSYGSIKLSNNGSVTFSGNTATASSASGGAIHVYGGDYSPITLRANGSVTFSGNSSTSSSSTAYGGAIYVYGSNYSPITLRANGSVTFSGNSSTSSSSTAYGGAIYIVESSYITLSNNGSVTFSGNSSTSSSSTAYGGAIYGGDDSTITLSNNESVTFSGNSASGEDYAYGGAIYIGESSTITLSNNGSVTFSGNKATSSDDYAYGGAIYGYGNSTITLSNNGSVTFRENTASSYGGAIYGDDDITLSANGSVTFSGNKASGGYAYGGAIYGGNYSTITLSANGSVTFSGNTSTAYGGAIRAYGNLSIRNNDSVLFEKNAEISNGSYRLRSIDAGGSGDVVSLSAAKEKSIEFRDSVYINSGSTVKFNEDYTDAAGLVHKQEGDIIFTGATTVDDLYEVKGDVAGTEEEILLSRTTEVQAMTNLYGGRLRVEDGAIYQGRGITAMAGSGATVRVQDAELNHGGYDLTFNSGTSLELVGDYSLLCSTLMMEEGSTLLLDASSAIGTCDLTGNLTMNGSMQLLLGETTAAMENAVLMWVSGEVSGWTDSSLTLNGSTGNAHIKWVNNHLVLNYKASTYNQYFNGSIAYSERQFAPLFYHHYEEISFKDIAYSTSSSSASGGAIYGGNYSSITLSNNGSVTFSGNKATSSDDYASGGAIYGGNRSTITLSNNESVTFSGNKTTKSSYYSACGGAIYGGDYSTITLSNNGSVTFSENSASGSSAYGGAIYGYVGDIMLSNNGSVIFSENSASGSSAYGGAIYGYGGDIMLSNNGSVIFSENSASGSSAYGGAIRTYGNLNIRNNDSVLFEKNAEISNGSYRLRSIYAGGSGDVVSLSAAKGKSIEFRDSVYIASGSKVKFNEDYTDAAGLVHKQEGDIIFTGAYTETHLNELLAEAGRTATAAEIENSRLTFVDAETRLYGGRLRVEDGAVYQGCGITAMAGSGATVRVQDAELKHGGYDLTFNSGTTLELCGKSILSGDLNLQSGSTLRLLDGSTSHSGNLSVDGGVEINLSGIEFSSGSNRLMILQTDAASITWAPTYTLVRVANFAQTGNEGYVSYGVLEWESGKLYVDEAITNTATWNNATGNGLWDGKSENWVYEENRLVDIQGIEHVILGETAQGNIRLEGEICVGNIQVKDGCAYILNPAEGAGLQLTGTLSLEGLSSLSVNGDLMAAAVSGEGALSVQDSLLVSGAVQAESLHVDTLVAGSLKAGSLQASSLTLTDADATNTIGNSVAMSGAVDVAGELEINGALTAGSLQAASLQASLLRLTDADATNTIGNNVATSGAVDVAGELEINGTLTAGSLRAGSLQASSLRLTDDEADNSVDGVVTVSGDITSAGSLSAGGAMSGNAIDVKGALTAGSLQAASLQASSLTLKDVGADNSVDGVVTVSGDITSADSLSVGGAMSANAIDVKGALTAGSLKAGSLQASSLTLTDADVTNTIGNSVAMSGAVDVAGELEINGALTAGSLKAGSLQASSLTLTDADATNTIGNSVDMSGDITSAGNLRVDGAMSANAIEVNRALTAGSLQAGSLQASSLTLTDADATNTIGNSVAMSGAVDVAGELEINGTLTAGSLRAGSLQASSLTLTDADATNTIGNSVAMSGDITSAGSLRVDGAVSANAIDVNGALTAGSLQAGSVQASSLTLAQAGVGSTVGGDMNVGSLELASGAALKVGGALTANEVQMTGTALTLTAGSFGASSMNFELDRAALESLGLGYGQTRTIAQSGTALAPGFVATLNDGQEPVTAAAYNYSISIDVSGGDVYLTADYAYDGLRTWYRGAWVGDSSWTKFYIGGFDAVDGVEVVDLNGTTVEGANLFIAYEDGESASIVKNGTLEFEYVDMGGGQFELGEATEMITDKLYGKVETLVVHENASLDTPNLTLGTLVMDGGEVTLKKATINAMSGTEGTLIIDRRGMVTVGSDVTLTGLNNEGTLDLGEHALVVNALVDVGGNVAAGEVTVKSLGSCMAVFDTLEADKVTVKNAISAGNYTDGISVGDGSSIGELVAETLEVREGEVTLGRTSGSTEMSLLNLDLQEDAELVLLQQTALTVTNKLTATEGATVQLHKGAGISYGEVSIANRKNDSTTAVNAYELSKGTIESLSNAHISMNSSDDSTIDWKLINSSVENTGSGTVTITNADNSLTDVYATHGNITILQQESLNLAELKVGASVTVSAYTGDTESPEYEATITVSDKVSLGAEATLNTDLIIEAGATLEMGGTVDMGSKLYLNSNTTLGGELLTTIQTAKLGSTVTLFTGIDALYFNGKEQTASITLDDRLSAGLYFSNLLDTDNRFYYMLYEAPINGDGMLSIVVDGLVVPEPTTATLSLLALAALAARRRRTHEK